MSRVDSLRGGVGGQLTSTDGATAVVIVVGLAACTDAVRVTTVSPNPADGRAMSAATVAGAPAAAATLGAVTSGKPTFGVTISPEAAGSTPVLSNSARTSTIKSRSICLRSSA